MHLEVLTKLDPLVEQWFRSRFERVTEPQELGWPAIERGGDVLISAPTGSGKTLTAFLLSIDHLVKAARAGTLQTGPSVVYISPLKALSNDIHKNLEVPLAEILGLARAEGVDLPTIRAAVRTGDSTAWDRRKLIEDPPHILVTTPESLYILLTAARSRETLRNVRTMIVDEVHAIADDKRGSHLALSLERLDHLVMSTGNPRPQRIGLSATVSPIEEVAQFLGPVVEIVNVGHRRAMDIAVEVPKDELGPVASNEMWGEIYDRLAELTAAHRTTLVFVNTRRMSERVAHHLGERIGADAVLPHHGSLSTALRKRAEQRLKDGELKAVVATASLELGLDIGHVELVCQIGSPRAIAVALQRIGRAGHWVGALPKGRLFATTRDELLECAALVRAIRAGELDKLEVPLNALDILAQQIVAMAAADDWTEDELFDLARRAYPYRDLPRSDFDDIIEMLSEGIATSRGRSGAFLHRDQVNHRIRGRRGARLASITSGGAIPDNALYAVIAEPEGTRVGTLDEDFAVESLAGDVFLLGTTSWRIRRVEAGRVRVEDAHGAAPTIPFWRGEAPGRTLELSEAVSQLREDIASRGSDEARAMLMEECSVDPLGADQAIAYVNGGKAILGTVPTQRCVVAERFFDESGGMQLVIHAPFGSRINRAWGLALRKRFCRSFNFELQAAATDNGLVLSLSDQHAFPLEVVFAFVKPQTAEHLLTQALLASPMFTARWRWNANRALAVLRFSGGRKVPPNIQRMRSDDLLASTFPDQAACPENLAGEVRIPDHPLVKETISNCLYEAMDLPGMIGVLEAIGEGTIRTVAIDTAEPSLFSHEILNANPYAYLDDAPLEERRARAVQMRSSLRSDLTDGAGALDPEAIAQVSSESWPVVRNADELHDALLTLVTAPPLPEWQDFFLELAGQRRATVLRDGEPSLWIPAEHIQLARLAHPDAVFEPEIDAVPARELPENREAAAAAILRGWMESIGPVLPADLARRTALPVDVVNAALALLEARGEILRGRFTSGLAEGEIEWCNRRVLARIHRMTLGRLRREIEPVSTAVFLRFLTRWQHVAKGARLHGADGLLEVLRQLQGYELPAAAWERDVLSRRIAAYTPELLDELCLSGEVMWGRLSPHPAFDREEKGRVRPTSSAPITLFLREDAEWLPARAPQSVPALSPVAAEVLDAIDRRGASFFAELTSATRHLASEVEDGLWELVAAGLITADGFENLRSLIDPKRRRGEGRSKSRRPRHAAGRWARLRHGEHTNSDEQFAMQLLRRWGVVFRDLAAREPLAGPWRNLLVALRRMEARGEIRGGRFVSGFIGEQFALPEALEALRALRRSTPDGEEVTLDATDPLNLTGGILPGDRLGILSGGFVRLRDGVPVEEPVPVNLSELHAPHYTPARP